MNPVKLLTFGFWILRRVYEDKLYHDISGDFEELYENRKDQKGKAIATIRFYVDALLSIPNITRKLKQRTYTMISFDTFANYLKMGFRVLKKNPITSCISIFGLAAAVACTTTASLWIDFQSNLDSFHSNKSRIYQVTSHILEEGEDVHYGSSPILLGPQLTASHTEVEASTRIQRKECIVKHQSNVFRESVQFVDPAFLSIFDFPLLAGSERSLSSDNQVVIGKELAIKYFGDQDPLGQVIEFHFQEDQQFLFTVAGVLDDIPDNSSMSFSLLIPFTNYFKLYPGPVNWSHNAEATMVLVKDQSAKLQDLSEVFRRQQNASGTNFPIESFEFIPLKILGNLSDEIYRPVAYGSSPSDYWSMGFVGYLMLVLACINYLNIAVSSGTKRLKEIALRKTMGGSRSQIIYQFLAENALICLFSLVLGFSLCYFFLLPGFNSLAPVNLKFRFSSWQNTTLFFFSVWLLMVVLAGAYPSFYISRYGPASIFCGKLKFRSKNYLSKVLLTLQLFLAFTTVIASVIFTDNAMYVKEQGWGYDQNNLMSVRLLADVDYDELRDFLTADPSIKQVVGSKGHIGWDNRFVDFEFLNKQFRAIAYKVSPKYLATLDVHLVEGMLHDPSNQTDEHGVVVNQLFVEKMGWEQPLGQVFDFDGQSRTVVGIIENTRHAFFSAEQLRPMIFTTGKNGFDYLTVKYTGHSERLESKLREHLLHLAPNEPFMVSYQNRLFDRYYDMVDANIKLMTFIGGMAIILSCLGLYGLVSYMIQSRIKELGIRKVLGANKKHMIRLTLKEYAWVLIIAFGVGGPIGPLGVQSTVEALFCIAKPFSLFPVLFALILMLSAIVLTVLKEIITLIRLNPVETLRDD
jgi:putative ABC transport system permease protein